VTPLVPDRDAVLAQVGDVGVAAQEPEQLVDDRAQVQLLGGDQRESLREVEAHLVAEDAARPGAGAIAAHGAALEDQPQEVVVLAHGGTRIVGRGA